MLSADELKARLITLTETLIGIRYHMSGEVISVLSLEGRYYNCYEQTQRARDNYDIVTIAIQLHYEPIM